MQKISIPLYSLAPDGSPATPQIAHDWCAQLEAGDILFFPQSPIHIRADDLAFLLGQQQSGSSFHKNIAYRPASNTAPGPNPASHEDRVTGLDDSTSPESRERLRRFMREYSSSVVRFLSKFLAPYHSRWHLDYASFRPQEEESRDLPLRRRNDLLHTDAFPTRPTHGARILRFFNNIHPERTRDWITTDTFEVLAHRFAPEKIALPATPSRLNLSLRRAGQSIGLAKLIPSIKRPPYDDFMMRFHNFLKENAEFQRNCSKQNWRFPAGSSWMVYTDTVSHAVLAGQYALEQTLLVSPEAMVAPHISPLGVLERMTGSRLV
jgi:hypothetical protein